MVTDKEIERYYELHSLLDTNWELSVKEYKEYIKICMDLTYVVMYKNKDVLEKLNLR